MADIKDIIEALRFEQELRKTGAIPSEEIRIGKRNPRDGTYEARQPNGSREKGIKTSNGGTNTNQLVRGIRGADIWGLDWKNIVKAAPKTEKKTKSSVAILYSKLETINGQQTRVFYVGGLKKEQDKLPEKLNTNKGSFNAYIWHKNTDYYVDTLSINGVFIANNEPLLTEYSSKRKIVKQHNNPFLDTVGWCGYGRWHSHCIVPAFDIFPGSAIVLNARDYIESTGNLVATNSTETFTGSFKVESGWKDRKVLINKKGLLTINSVSSNPPSAQASWNLNLENYIKDEKPENNYATTNSSTVNMVGFGSSATGTRTGATTEYRTFLSNNKGDLLIAKMTTTYINAKSYTMQVDFILKTNTEQIEFKAYKFLWVFGVKTFEYKLKDWCPKCDELTNLFDGWLFLTTLHNTGHALMYAINDLATSPTNFIFFDSQQFYKSIAWVNDNIFIFTPSNEEKVLSEINKPPKKVNLELLSFKINKTGEAIFTKSTKKEKVSCFQVPITAVSPITIHSFSYWKT